MSEDHKPNKPAAPKIILPKKPPTPQTAQTYGSKNPKGFANISAVQRPQKRSPRGR